MKVCFLVTEYIFFKEFWWKVAQQAAKDGDECIFLVDGKIAEYGRKRDLETQNMKFFSKVDWCIENYNPDKNDFGALSWKEFFPDFARYKIGSFNYKNSVGAVLQIHQFMDFVFEKEKPDLIISGCPSNLFEQITRYFADKNNVPWLALSESILGESRIDVHNLEHTNSLLAPTFENLKESDITKDEKKLAEAFFEKFLSHKKRPDYMRDQDMYLSYFNLLRGYVARIVRVKERLKVFYKYIRNRKKFRKYDYRSELVLSRFLGVFIEDAKRQLRTILQKKFFDKYDYKKDKFFLYPLHFQPEYTTSVLATYYTDQASTVRNIAFALPFGYRLYVKEHPSSVGTRPDWFYERIKEVPNIVLVPANESVEELIKNSSGLVVLSGTMGMEAALAGKPVYILGKVFYMYHPLCKKIGNFDELKESTINDLSNKQDIGDLKDINLRFAVSYIRNTVLGSIISGARAKDTNDYSSIYGNFKKILNNIKNYENS